jgi:hypothetical protein
VPRFKGDGFGLDGSSEAPLKDRVYVNINSSDYVRNRTAIGKVVFWLICAYGTIIKISLKGKKLKC